MKNKFTILLLAVLASSQFAQDKKVKESSNIKKVIPPRMFTFTSMGDERLNVDGVTYNNYKLIRTLRYVAKEGRSKKMHEYYLVDGNVESTSNDKPEYCRVTNVEDKLVVDEYDIEDTCEMHFGGGGFRNVFLKAVKFYANMFNKYVSNKEGNLFIKPLGKNRHYIRLFVDDIEFRLTAHIEKGGKIGQTYQFIVTDPNKKKPKKGIVKLIIDKDYSKVIQDIISELVKKTIKTTGIKFGNRKGEVAKSNDVLSIF